MLRSRRTTKKTTWAAIAAAVVVHGTVLGTVHAVGASLVGDGFTATGTKKAHVEDELELKPSCVGDVLLATSMRAVTCLVPWHADNGDECLDDLPTNMWLDLSSCQAQTDHGTAISLMEPKTADKVKPIDIEKLEDEMKQLAEQKQKPPPPVPPPQAAPPPPPPPPAPARPMQVVETVKPNKEQAPDNARLLAEYDTKVDKEKVARGTAKEPMIAKSKPADLTPKEHPKDEPSVKKLEPDRMPGKDVRAPDVPNTLSMRSPGAKAPAETAQDQKTRGSANGGKGPQVADGYTPKRGDGQIQQDHHEDSQQPKGQDGGGGGAPQVPNLKPSQEVLERVVGGGNVDHLDVDNGDETSLSAKRWIYASFFNRLKRQVAQNWDPGSVWRRADPTGTVYGFKTRITEVRVSLSKVGELSKIVVTQPSGVGDLDDEAVHAFHAAAPFPNPPEGLLSKDNLITFAFSFYFEIGAPRSSWRVIRSM